MSQVQELARLRDLRPMMRLAALLPALLLSLAVPAIALAQGPVQVYFLPPADTLVTGQPVTVDVVAEGVRNLYGAEIHLRFDPAAVRLEDADLNQDGVQLSPGSLLDPANGFVAANRVDHQAGTAVFAVTLVNPAPPVDGSGVVARLTLEPLRPGVLRLALENVKLVTRDLHTLDVSSSGLEVLVSGRAVAPAGGGQPVSSVASPSSVTGAAPARGVPIWALVLVALGMVIIPLMGVGLFFVREIRHRRPGLTRS